MKKHVSVRQKKLLAPTPGLKKRRGYLRFLSSRGAFRAVSRTIFVVQPIVHNCLTSAPASSAKTAASSATARSDVPALNTATFPINDDDGLPPVEAVPGAGAVVPGVGVGVTGSVSAAPAGATDWESPNDTMRASA